MGDECKSMSSMSDVQVLAHCAGMVKAVSSTLHDLKMRIGSRSRRGVASPLGMNELMPLFDAVNSLNKQTSKLKRKALHSRGELFDQVSTGKSTAAFGADSL
jgi:hypothetical protein